MNIKKQYYRILYHITKLPKYRHLYKQDFGINNKIYIINESGIKQEYPAYYDLKNINIHWNGDNNTFTIAKPNSVMKMDIYFYGNNNQIIIGKKARGNFNIRLYYDNNYVNFGNRVEAQYINIMLHSDSLTIGDNCMFSNLINIITDGHSVIDSNTKELLNIPKHNITIGNHVWISQGATILKNAQIANNSIVAHSAVVTKPFNETNVIIAGNPAKIVKRNISWNHDSPLEYSPETADFSF